MTSEEAREAFQLGYGVARQRQRRRERLAELGRSFYHAVWWWAWLTCLGRIGDATLRAVLGALPWGPA